MDPSQFPPIVPFREFGAKVQLLSGSLVTAVSALDTLPTDSVPRTTQALDASAQLLQKNIPALKAALEKALSVVADSEA